MKSERKFSIIYSTYPDLCDKQSTERQEGRDWLMNCVHAQAVSRALLEVTRTEGNTDAEAVVVELILRTVYHRQKWKRRKKENNIR